MGHGIFSTHVKQHDEVDDQVMYAAEVCLWQLCFNYLATTSVECNSTYDQNSNKQKSRPSYCFGAPTSGDLEIDGHWR